MTLLHQIETIRKDFPILLQSVSGRTPVYFDNACTSLVPKQVIEVIADCYFNYPTCSGDRSSHRLSEQIHRRIEGDTQDGELGARQKIQTFINARSPDQVVFTQNTTHAINLVALGLSMVPGAVVLQTDTEHNSNLLPWLRLQQQGLIRVRHISTDGVGNADLEDLRLQFEHNPVGLVSMGYTSNLTGATIAAKEITQLAHRYNVPVLLDAAQTAPHQSIDVQQLDVDYLAFSLHKMCGPKGVGVLYIKNPSDGTQLKPIILGGGAVSDATYSSYDLMTAPDIFEVGVQNYPGQIAAGTAIGYLQHIGMDNIHNHEIELNRFFKPTTSRTLWGHWMVSNSGSSGASSARRYSYV